MQKAQLIQTLTLPMLLLGIVLSSIPYIALTRAIMGIDDTISLPFTTTLIFLIAGYMSALAAMISLCRQAQNTETGASSPTNDETVSRAAQKKPHYLGLSLLIPVPFISFILVYWFWRKEGWHSRVLDSEYRKSVNFQITVHLYWLLSFFLMPIVVGFLAFALIFALHLISTVALIIKTPSNSNVNYPANITII